MTHGPRGSSEGPARRAAWLLAAVAAGGLAAEVSGTGRPRAAFRPPALLSETGLYARAGSLDVAPGNRPYSPQYPLWSDGAAKARWVLLPPGAKIDARSLDDWDFPVGTKLWKEFSFGGRKVETRLMWKAAAAEWVFAAYAWDEEGTQARLVPEAGLPRHLEIAPGRFHTIPGVADCRSCHVNGRTEVLGFSALQLSDDRDPLAPHAEPLLPGMVTLGGLVREGRLRPARPDLVRAPPRIVAADPRARAVLGYLSANCGSCHRGDVPLAGLALDLRQTLAASHGPLSAIGASSRWSVPGAPSGASRLVDPGSPATSALLVRMASRDPFRQMPPLGTVLVDEEAVRLVESWIAEMKGPAGGPDRSAQKR